MPSNAILEQKKQVVADLAEQIKTSAAGVVVNYQGITVENDTALRKALREAGVKYVVMKNTLTGRACEMCGYGDMKQYLNGMTAIAISTAEDPIAPAKILKEYADKISSWAKDAMNWAVSVGLINGTGAGQLAPAATATRAEVASILMRFELNVVK